MKDKNTKKDRYSILVSMLDKCYICGSSPVHLHEIFFGTANRKKSIEDGLVIPLCPSHHNMSGTGVHFNKELDNYLKIQAEKVWIATYTTEDMSEDEKIQAFIDRFGKNYIL